MVGFNLYCNIPRSIFNDLTADSDNHLRNAYTAVVDSLEKLCWINSRIFFRSYFDFAIDQTDFDALNARLASEVLLHPVCSKISSHPFDAHFDVLERALADLASQGFVGSLSADL